MSSIMNLLLIFRFVTILVKRPKQSNTLPVNFILSLHSNPHIFTLNQISDQILCLTHFLYILVIYLLQISYMQQLLLQIRSLPLILTLMNFKHFIHDFVFQSKIVNRGMNEISERDKLVVHVFYFFV